jgi:N-acetylglucosaminyldiphosphoundecaprenol N-acetyl-beta-D-mannosaminyltransferase
MTLASETRRCSDRAGIQGSPIVGEPDSSIRASALTFRVLGVPVHAVQIPEVIEHMESWIRDCTAGQFIAVTGMHGVSESLREPRFRTILESASLVVPDGMPLVWLGRWNGHNLKRRVYGPELMETFCRLTGNQYRHFFYGGANGVPERLAEVLEQRYSVRVVGTYSPPFRSLRQEETDEVLERIRIANPDVLWVGLSTPKQEGWMYEHRDRLSIPVMVGVGAAFDFHTGRVKQAPTWMRENGLEWLFRLLSEPRRLWRRYLIQGTQFTWNVGLEMLRIKHFG